MRTHHSVDRYIPDGVIAVEEYGDLCIAEVAATDLVRIAESLARTHHLPLEVITAFDERAERKDFRILYVFGVPEGCWFLALSIRARDRFPSLTPTLHEASMYERKIHSFFGLIPDGHPSPRSFLLHEENWPADVFPLRKDFDWRTRPPEAHGAFPFRTVQGEGVYEIPVGPVHAGIIEPGHFRFHVAGEEILTLEPRLGYSHKGSEKRFEALPLSEKIRLAERVSGDSSFAHALACCQAFEQLAGVEVPERARVLRVICAELERIANHFGDIGMIMLDTGFTFGGAHGARLREAIVQIHERIGGSRFLRGVQAIGGVTRDIGDRDAAALVSELARIREDFTEVMEVAERSSSLVNRLRDTGRLDPAIARDHGVVGVAGRAVGFPVDARADFPYAAYDQFPVTPVVEESGDVYARFMVRVREVHASMDILTQALRSLPAGPIIAPRIPAFWKRAFAVSVVEGWRGAIVYTVATDAAGEVSRVDVRDPSLLNWTVLGYAGQGNMVPDFPLINKSFNLSYSGNDA